jgi:hypothetical protein
MGAPTGGAVCGAAIGSSAATVKLDTSRSCILRAERTQVFYTLL